MLKGQISLLLATAVFLPTGALSQTSQQYDLTAQELNEVQRDYYAISNGLQLSVLVEAVRSGHGKIDNLDATQQPMADAQSFKASVSNLTIGKIGDIQNQLVTDFATIPAPGSNVVHLAITHEPIPDTDDKSTSIKATWGPMETQPSASLSSMTMEDLVGELSAKTGKQYLRYIAYSVNLSYQGQSANYKAIYLFAADDNPFDRVIIDLCLTGPRFSDNPNAYRPGRLLRSPWRDVPAVHEWLMAHTTMDSHCPPTIDPCCIEGQCAMSLDFMNREMSRPPMVAQPTTGGPAGASFSPSWRNPEGHPMRASFPSLFHRSHPLLGGGQDGPSCTSPGAAPNNCTCDITGCEYIPLPWTTSSGATCQVFVHQRMITVMNGILPTGAYHNWVVAIVHAPGYGNQPEVFDGGPTYIGPSPFGYIGAWATVGGEGREDGDMAGGSGWFQLPNGMNSDNCETAADIQSWIWYYGPTSSQVYYLLGPNSNSVAFSMMYWSGYLIPTAPNTDPGWGMSMLLN